MLKHISIIYLLIGLLGCNSLTINSTKIDEENKIETIFEDTTQVEVIEEITDDLITNETIKDYDLTVLKGSSYPKIKNNTPFTNTELEILQHSEGLELEATVEVAHYFKYFLRDKRDLLNQWIDNASPNLPYIRELFLQHNIPEELIFLPFLESGYNVQAYSRVGAGGIWQFMPSTALSYGLKINWWVDERRSPYLATPFAIQHLIYLNNLFGDWYTALAAYNAGQGRVSRAMNSVGIYDYFDLIKTEALPKETRRYVLQYLAIVKIMKNSEELGLHSLNWDKLTERIVLNIKGGTDLDELTNSIDLSWNDFIKLNPEFRRKVSDPSRESTIILPKTLETVAKNYISNSKPIITNTGFTNYTVKSGDSWWYLSSLTNHSIENLKKYNNIYSDNLQIGQKLLIPGYSSNYTQTVSTEPTTSGKLQSYVIKSGDTISSISIKYNIKLTSLYRENNLNSRSILKVGQVIYLPGYPVIDDSNLNEESDSHYVVQEGDSIWIIAQKTKIPYTKLLTINNLNSNSRLNIGDKISLY